MDGATSEPSNIRWDKASPRTWIARIPRFDKATDDLVGLTLERPQGWTLYINHVRIATFNTWEEADGAVPMLYKLHKDSL